MAAPAAKPDARAALTEARLTAPAPSAEAPWAREARTAALARLRAAGLPMRRDEYWKWTDPSALTAAEAAPAALPETPEDGGDDGVFDGVDALTLTFVDGVLRPDLSDAMALEGVEIARLSDALAKDIHWARDLFGVLEARGQSPVPRTLAALTTAQATEGVALRVTGRAPRPIRLRCLRDAAAADAQLHHLIRLEEGAELTLLETGPAAARLSQVTEVDLAPGARFHHVRTQGRDPQRRAITHVFARVGQGARYKSFTLTVNGALTRNEHVVEMTGDDAVAHMAGAAAGTGALHHDDTVFVTHAAERGESRQVFKKVLRDGAKGVFHGKILVKQAAQKTDGYQISQGLLLDDEADFLAKPELEIYADDVKCSHGSTVGAVDEDALYYLRARGVPKDQAQALLVLAFLGQAIDEIEDEALAEEIRTRVAVWIGGAAAGAA